MDDTTTPATAAAAAATHVLRNAYAELHEAYPFMDTEKLKTLLEKVEDQLRQELKAGEKAAADSKARFSFSKLPAELRNYVYELVLEPRDDHDYFETQRTPATDKSPAIQTSRIPSLLHVSRQFRAEAFPIFFANTRFRATYVSTLTPTCLAANFFAMFDLELIKKIRSLVVHFRASSIFHVVMQMYKLKDHEKLWKQVGARRPASIHKREVVEFLQLKESGVEEGLISVSYYDLESEAVVQIMD